MPLEIQLRGKKFAKGKRTRRYLVGKDEEEEAAPAADDVVNEPKLISRQSAEINYVIPLGKAVISKLILGHKKCPKREQKGKK